MERLFVYGTLAPGQVNAGMLEKLGGTWTRGTIRGRLRDAGWGAAEGCPGIDLDTTGDEIPGFVFSSDALDRFWNELDRFEGDEYQRVQVPATLASGDVVEVWVYSLAAHA